MRVRLHVFMPDSSEGPLHDAAELFKALSSPARLALIRELVDEPKDVTALTEATGMSQPLVSQHLRTLRLAGLAEAERTGRHAIYRITDQHVAHIVCDAVEHAGEH